MSDPNVEPAIGNADPSTLVPDMNGGATQAAPTPGTENVTSAGEDGFEISEASTAGGRDGSAA